MNVVVHVDTGKPVHKTYFMISRQNTIIVPASNYVHLFMRTSLPNAGAKHERVEQGARFFRIFPELSHTPSPIYFNISQHAWRKAKTCCVLNKRVLVRFGQAGRAGGGY